MQHIPKEVEAFFAQQREEQQKLNMTAKVRKNLRETQHTMHGVFEKLLMRGQDVNAVADESEALLASSEEFVKQTQGLSWCGWCCAWIPEWWCKPRQKRNAKNSTVKNI